MSKAWVNNFTRGGHPQKISDFFSPFCAYLLTYLCTLQYQIIMQQILINFLKKSNLHTLIPSCTFINFKNSWLKSFIFTNEKRKSPTCMPLFHPACLLIFENLPSCTFIPSYMIIWYLRVYLFQIHKRYIPQLKYQIRCYWNNNRTRWCA